MLTGENRCVAAAWHFICTTSEGDVFMLGTDCSFKIYNQVIPLKLIVFVSLQQTYFNVWQITFSFILFSIHVIIGVFCKMVKKQLIS